MRILGYVLLIFAFIAPASAADGNGVARAIGVLGILPPARSASAQNAPPGKMAEFVDAYETQMKAAFAVADPTRRIAAIVAARTNLGLSANRQLTPGGIQRIDSVLGLAPSPADLGTTP